MIDSQRHYPEFFPFHKIQIQKQVMFRRHFPKSSSILFFNFAKTKTLLRPPIPEDGEEEDEKEQKRKQLERKDQNIEDERILTDDVSILQKKECPRRNLWINQEMKHLFPQTTRK